MSIFMTTFSFDFPVNLAKTISSIMSLKSSDLENCTGCFFLAKRFPSCSEMTKLPPMFPRTVRIAVRFLTESTVFENSLMFPVVFSSFDAWKTY